MMDTKQTISFHLIRETNSEKWNSFFSKTTSLSVFNSWEWGKAKSHLWTPEYISITHDGKVIAQTLILFKKKMGVKVGWAPGGIALTQDNLLSGVLQKIKESYNMLNTIIRFNFYNEYDENLILELKKSGLTQALNSMNSGYSIHHDCRLMDDDFEKGFSKNNRYYYKQSLKQELSLSILDQNAIDEFISLHDQMTSEKKLTHLKLDSSWVTRLAESFGSKFKIFLVKDQSSNPLAGCLILESGNQSFYFLASASPEGRKKSASFFLVREVLNYYREKQFDFDFGGIAPNDPSAKGVDRFKQGFKGREFRYLGEWEMTRNPLLKALLNNMISRN